MKTKIFYEALDAIHYAIIDNISYYEKRGDLIVFVDAEDTEIAAFKYSIFLCCYQIEDVS